MCHKHFLLEIPAPPHHPPSLLIGSVISRKRQGCSVLEQPLVLCVGRGSHVMINSWVRWHPLYPLLQVLQDASVAEVVDVPAEVHQLGVDVRGHTAVGGRGEVGAAGHHAGAARWGAFGTPLHQGTKSTQKHTHTHTGGKENKNPCFLSGTNQIYLHAPAPLSGNNKQANTKQIVANYV